MKCITPEWTFTNNKLSSGVDDSISVSISFDINEWLSIGTGDVRSIEYIDNKSDTVDQLTNAKQDECELVISHQWTFFYVISKNKWEDVDNKNNKKKKRNKDESELAWLDNEDERRRHIVAAVGSSKRGNATKKNNYNERGRATRHDITIQF